MLAIGETDFAFKFILFAIFAGCCVAQLWLGGLVASALQARHPKVWKTLWWPNKLFWFAITRRDRALNDPRLSAQTCRLQVSLLIAFASWLAGLVSLLARG